MDMRRMIGIRTGIGMARGGTGTAHIDTTTTETDIGIRDHDTMRDTDPADTEVTGNTENIGIETGIDNIEAREMIGTTRMDRGHRMTSPRKKGAKRILIRRPYSEIHG